MDTNFYFTKEDSDVKNKPKKKRILLQYESSKMDKTENGAVPETDNQYHYYTHFVRASEIVEIYSNKIQSIKYSDVSR
jgi:hypothetical protein